MTVSCDEDAHLLAANAPTCSHTTAFSRWAVREPLLPFARLENVRFVGLDHAAELGLHRLRNGTERFVAPVEGGRDVYAQSIRDFAKANTLKHQVQELLPLISVVRAVKGRAGKVIE